MKYHILHNRCYNYVQFHKRSSDIPSCFLEPVLDVATLVMVGYRICQLTNIGVYTFV